MKISKPLLITLCFFLITELCLQIKFRFFTGIVMRDDDDYEYIPVANQNISRNGRNIYYNSLSMRSSEPDSTKNKILAFGDSIINGGELIDQDSLATVLLNSSFKYKYQFLNISAGSWGPDNCFAYLKRHGNFGAKHIILFVSSHDAYDNMQFNKYAKYGNGKLSGLALYLFFERHIRPKYFNTREKTKKEHIYHNGFNTGFANFFNYCKAKNISLTIYLHPELDEINQQKYNSKGQEIIQFCKEKNIDFIQGLSYGFKKDFYSDNIHLNELGQKQLAFAVKTALVDLQ